MAIFLIACDEGIIRLFTIFYLHRKFLDIFEKRLQLKGQKRSRYFLRKYRNSKAVSFKKQFYYSLISTSTDILRNDPDYKDVDLQKTRKRYVIIESSDFTRNIYWLASRFSKNKETEQSFFRKSKQDCRCTQFHIYHSNILI